MLIERDLASLKDKQQHLEILANMIIEVFAIDSVVNRTRLLVGHGTQQDDDLRVALTNVYVASANERASRVRELEHLLRDRSFYDNGMLKAVRIRERPTNRLGSEVRSSVRGV